MSYLYLLVAASVPAAFVGTMSWFGVYTFVNAYLIKDLGCTNEQWTLATLWYSGGMVFWYLACTEISSRIGRRLTVTIGLAATAAGYGLLAFSSNVFIIDVLLMFIGFTTVANAVAWMPLIADAGGDRPGRALALNAFIGTAVGVLTLLMGGRLIAGGDYRRAFLIVSAACFVSAIAFHVLAGPLERMSRTKVVRLRDISRTDLAGMVRGPFLIVLLVGVCMDPFSFHTVNQLSPNIARDVHGFREADISLLVALGRIPALVSLYAISKLIDRLNVIRWFALGLFFDGACTILIGIASGGHALTSTYMLFYLVHGVVWGTEVVAINWCLPLRVRDSGFAITWMFEIFAVFLAGFVHNRILQGGFSLNCVFVSCGVIAAIAGTALILYSCSSHSRRTPSYEA